MTFNFIITLVLITIAYQLYRLNRNLRYTKSISIKKVNLLEMDEKVLNEKVKNFIFRNDGDSKTYLHYTMAEENALRIMKEGFKYSDSFYKTAELIDEDWNYESYVHYRQKTFGKNIVIIKIPKLVYNRSKKIYTELKLSPFPPIENILSRVLPKLENKDHELTHILSPRFIKGYMNYSENRLVMNESYDPNIKEDELHRLILKSIAN